MNVGKFDHVARKRKDTQKHISLFHMSQAIENVIITPLILDTLSAKPVPVPVSSAEIHEWKGITILSIPSFVSSTHPNLIRASWGREKDID